jgi:hypothetical protein
LIGRSIGHLTRRAGLSIDNVLGAEVVLAGGSVVTADENNNDDLYWAIRGGGGNFGIVTSLRLRLHPISTVVAGPMFWPLDRTADILRWYREFILNAPEDLNGFFAFATVPPAPPFPEELHLQKVAGVVWCWTGPEDGADAALAEARAQPDLLLDGVQPMPLPALQSAFDELYPAGDQWYWRADFVEQQSSSSTSYQGRIEWPSIFWIRERTDTPPRPCRPDRGAAGTRRNNRRPFSTVAPGLPAWKRTRLGDPWRRRNPPGLAAGDQPQRCFLFSAWYASPCSRAFPISPGFTSSPSRLLDSGEPFSATGVETESLHRAILRRGRHRAGRRIGRLGRPILPVRATEARSKERPCLAV